MAVGIRYAAVGSARVAFQTHGEGETDIVYSPGMPSHLDLTYDQPRYRRVIEELARYGRVIRFDRRGVGLSDPVPADAEASWEMWADDLAAVLDEAGSNRAVIIASNDAGAPAVLFAATRPDRVRGLVLFNTTVRFLAAPDYPQGHPPEAAAAMLEGLKQVWGTEASCDLLAPSLASDQPFRVWYARFQRAACSPTALADSFAQLLEMDARGALSEVRCPTVVMHRRDYPILATSHAEYIAEHIPGARLHLLDGSDSSFYTQRAQEVVDEVGAFIEDGPVPATDDGVFATVLFTDIVESTTRAAELGDRRWNELLDAHDTQIRDAVAVHGGAVIKSTGDGMLATFESPTRALRCAADVHARTDALDVTIRAGLHAGPLVMRGDGDISGLAVNAAARVLGAAGPGRTLVSNSVIDLVGEGDFTITTVGERQLKGLPGTWELFEVASA